MAETSSVIHAIGGIRARITSGNIIFAGFINYLVLFFIVVGSLFLSSVESFGLYRSGARRYYPHQTSSSLQMGKYDSFW